MSKPKPPTRAERREQRSIVPQEGIYGVDADDAGADSWTGRYLCWASSPAEAKRRVVGAGFHKRQVRQHWSPGNLPLEGVPAALGPAFEGWFRSRDDDGGWTDWEALPADYGHPPQSLAAIDPSVR